MDIPCLTRVMCPLYIQSNLDSSNLDGSFTMANLHLHLNPNEILSIAEENKYFGNFYHFIMELYVVCTH